MPHPAIPGSAFLDALPIREAAVGHGALGLHGELGYEGRRAVAGGRPWSHALGAHPPSRLAFAVDGRYGRLRCSVAIHDDVPAGRTHADFLVYGDGRALAVAPRVEAGAPPRELAADLRGVRSLELVVRTSRWEDCHALWLDPIVAAMPADAGREPVRDCLRRTAITPPAGLAGADRVIATIASRGFAALLDDMLGSLRAHGGCPDVPVAVFAVDPDPECLGVAAKYGATVVPCALESPLNATVKSALYSAARVLDARQFLGLDADLLVLGDLRPIFAALEACPEGAILACREGNEPGFPTLGRALIDAYHGRPADLGRILGGDPGDAAAYPLVINDGVFAAGRAALLAADALIRTWPEAPAWVDERRDNWWRNQFVFNLALARLGAGVELDSTFNVQLQAQDVAFARQGGRIRATWRGRPARVAHFNGAGRAKHPEWRGHFARAAAAGAGAGAAPAEADRDATLRGHLRDLLDGRGAHPDFADAVADLPADLRGARPPGLPHTPWRLVEHLRIAQRDILDFCLDPGHVSPEFPAGYWPPGDAPTGPAAWDRTVAAFRADLRAIQDLVADPGRDLAAPLPHGQGRTLLREALLVADHNAYHVGQLITVRRLLGAWPG